MALAKPKFHLSEKILGQLYCGIDERKIWSEDNHRSVRTDGPSVWEQLMGRVQAELHSRGFKMLDNSHHQQAWKIRTLLVNPTIPPDHARCPD